MRMVLASCGAIALLAVATPAHADETSDARAKQLFTDAIAKVDRGDLNGALADYRAAYRLAPRAKILLNIGVVLQELGQHVQAAHAFEDYLKRDDADPKRVAAVRQRLTTLDRRLGKVALNVRKPGSRVSFDGAALGTSPLEIMRRAEPGTHIVLLTSPTGKQTSYPVTAIAGGVTQLVIAVGERAVAKEVSPAPPAVVHHRRRDTARPLLGRPWVWTGVLTAAVLATGALFGLQSRSLQDDVDALNAASSMHSFDEAQRIEDRARSRALLANISFGVAGVGAIATVVLALRDRKRSSRSRRSSLTAAPRHGGGQLILELSF